MLRVWRAASNRASRDRASLDRAVMNDDAPGKPLQIVPSYYSARRSAPAAKHPAPKETGVPINPGHSYTPSDQGEGERMPQSGNIGWLRNV